MDTEERDFNGYTLLQRTTLKGTAQDLSELITNGANIDAKNYRGFTALMLAVTKLDMNKMEVLLQAGADVNACNREGTTALMLACQFNDLPVINLLLNHGARVDTVNSYDESAVTYAMDQFRTRDVMSPFPWIINVEMLELLLSNGGRIHDVLMHDDVSSVESFFAEPRLCVFVEPYKERLSQEHLLLWKKHRLKSLL
jgi:ankyrin repeat protein